MTGPLSAPELMLSIRHASDLQEQCDLCRGLLGNPILLVDSTWTLLASSGIVDGQLEQIRAAAQRQLAAHAQATNCKSWLSINLSAWSPETDEGEIPLLAKVLYSRAQPLAVVILCATQAPFRPEDPALLSLVSDDLAVTLTRQQAYFSGEVVHSANLLIQLLNGDAIARHNIESYSRSYWNRDRYHYLILISNASGIPFYDVTDKVLYPLTSRYTTFPYLGNLVILMETKEEVADWQVHAELQAISSSQKFYIGISRYFHILETIPQHFYEAITSIRLGKDLQEQNAPIHNLFDYSDMAFYHMLDMASTNYNLLSFCNRKVLDLYRYEEQHGGDLVKTLMIYLDCCKNINETAKILFIHKNTVRYRISKCMDLMGTDLENGVEIFSILFSIRVFRYCQLTNRLPEDADDKLSDTPHPYI